LSLLIILDIFFTISFTGTAPPAIYTLSLHDALPIFRVTRPFILTIVAKEKAPSIPGKGELKLITFNICIASYHSFCLIEAMDKRSEEHTSELQSLRHLVCRLLLEKKKHAITHTNVNI